MKLSMKLSPVTKAALAAIAAISVSAAAFLVPMSHQKVQFSVPKKSILSGLSLNAAEFPPAAGWGPGQVFSRGMASAAERSTQDWPGGSRAIEVVGDGWISPVRGSFASSGSWQIVYRWQKPTPPPKATYTVGVAAGIRSEVTGAGFYLQQIGESLAQVNSDLESEQGDPPLLSSPPMTSTISTFWPAPVQHDSSGYYLSVPAFAVSGKVTQARYFQRWGGDIIAEVKFTQPS